MKKNFFKIVFYIQMLFTIYLLVMGIISICMSGKYFVFALMFLSISCLPLLAINFYGLKASKKYLENDLNEDSINKKEKILISASRIVTVLTIIINLIFASD